MTHLSDIAGIGPVLERQMRDRGIASVDDLSRAVPSDLTPIAGLGPRRAQKLIDAARLLLQDPTAAAPAAPGRPARRRRARRSAEPTASAPSPAPAPASPTVADDAPVTPTAQSQPVQKEPAMTATTTARVSRRTPLVFFTHPGPMTWVTDLDPDPETGAVRAEPRPRREPSHVLPAAHPQPGDTPDPVLSHPEPLLASLPPEEPLAETPDALATDIAAAQAIPGPIPPHDPGTPPPSDPSDKNHAGDGRGRKL